MSQIIVAFGNGILFLDPITKIFGIAVLFEPVPLFIDKFQGEPPVLIEAVVAGRGCVSLLVVGRLLPLCTPCNPLGKVRFLSWIDLLYIIVKFHTLHNI